MSKSTSTSESTFGLMLMSMFSLMSTVACGPPRFEGEIELDQKRGDSMRHSVAESHGDRMRTVDEGEPGYSLFDSRGRIYSVDPTKKEILVIDLGAEHEAGDRFEKTKTTETIAGHTCVVWNVTLNDGEHGDVCIATDVKPGGPTNMWFPKLTESGLPLRGKLQTPDGKVQIDMRVTAITPKKLDASHFELPKDYKKTSLFK